MEVLHREKLTRVGARCAYLVAERWFALVPGAEWLSSHVVLHEPLGERHEHIEFKLLVGVLLNQVVGDLGG